MRNCRTKSLARHSIQHGAATVEMALVLPIALLFMFGIFEYGRYFMTVQLMNNAAREGARYAITHLQPVTIGATTYGNATADVTNIITNVTAGVTLSSQSVSVYASDSQGNNLGPWTDAQAGQSVTVQITGNYLPMVTSFIGLPSTIPVTVKSAMDAEAN